ncbi:MAG TPA: DUF885 domain-containing protein [Acidisarcina sp.]
MRLPRSIRIHAGALAISFLLPMLLSHPATSYAADTIADRRKTLNSIFEEYWQSQLRHDPEFASTLGDKRYNDQLTDYSVKAYNEGLERGRGYIDRLGGVDTTGLSEQEILSRDLLVRELVEQQESAEYKPWQVPVNQFTGLHSSLPRLFPQLSYESSKDYDDYITRLGKIPGAFDQIMTNMSIGVGDHHTPPRYLLEKVLAQVNTLAAQKPEDSPFALPLKKFPASITAAEQQRIRKDALAAISTQLLPAYVRFARFLQSQYIPFGRPEPGVWAEPNGQKYYAFRIRQSTTTGLTADQIHQIGLDEVKRDEAEMLVIATRLGFADVAALRKAVASDPKFHPKSREELLALYRAHLDQMRPKLPELFGRLPKASLDVVPVPDFIEKDQAPAYYESGSPDGKRPGKIFINTYHFESRSTPFTESIAYHEGLPGHHLQISIAQEVEGLPEFRKHIFYTAYTEGWGLYAEHLGKDAGLYKDPYSDFGRLEADIFRAIRLVVDTGVHSKHWTRQQMVDYFHVHSGLDEASVQSEVDRYIAWPGQALGYKIGQLKILELRAKAQQELGPKFSLSAFHDQIVDSGVLPLDVLESRVTDWIAAQKSH